MMVANRGAIRAVFASLASVVTLGVGLASSEQSWAQSVSGSPMQLAQAQPTQQLPGAVERQVLQDAARRSQVPVKQLRIGSVTEQVFSNTCVFEFGDRCLPLNEPIAGWTVVVPVKGVPWTYHVDRTSNHLILDPRINQSARAGTTANEPNDESNAGSVHGCGVGRRGTAGECGTGNVTSLANEADDVWQSLSVSLWRVLHEGTQSN